ncbi:pectinesterase-like [Zingiber officinale]|uniref:Pectinesterase n=1 Tax=Zingiber officinale TaxID=94328 RepID=A0A8J5ED60_ZINOF|nr:pectinesterase-like [Zingiber officinale]KAG6472432.1 hypothetical protein ZIOFF_069895 [Zingiber officinale]
MSAFQDFSYLSERRRAERAQQRKRMIIAASTASVFLVVAVCAVIAVVYNPKPTESTHNSSAKSTTETFSPKSDSGSLIKDFQTNSAIKVICSPTDYRATCESTMKGATNSSSTPKDLVRAAVATIVDEVDKAFKKSDVIGTADPAVKSAVELCQKLHKYALKELANTLDTIDANHLNQLPNKVHELKNWLSATSTYQETCIDGFPDGEQKNKMKTELKTSKQLTSNALAIVGSLSSFLSLISKGGRRLLSEPPVEKPEVVREDGLPNWVDDDDRRFLLGRATKQMTPNVTVAKDGSMDFKTISEALAKMPTTVNGRYVIYVKEGVYEEQVVVDMNMINVTMYGDGSRKTVITGSKNFVDGTKTFETATFGEFSIVITDYLVNINSECNCAIGDGFIAMAIGFQNTAGAVKHQAVALRVQSDRAIFLNCRMEAYQDTLYAHTHRQFYRGCLILGTVDFIFGNAAAIFQNCILSVRRPLDNQQNIVLAQGRTDSHEATGFVIHNCRFTAEPELASGGKIPSYLGRPWKEFSHTVVMESEIGDFINPDGYMPWDGDFALKTLSYAEYGNKGAGADTSKRVKWLGFKVINRNEAVPYTPTTFIQGDDWIPKTGTPVRLGLFD